MKFILSAITRYFRDQQLANGSAAPAIVRHSASSFAWKNWKTAC